MSKVISLKGGKLVYHYPKLGMKFRLDFADDELTFQRLHIDGDSPSPPQPYQARRLENGAYIVATFNPSDDTYMSLIIEPDRGLLHNSMVWGPEQRANFDWIWGIEEARIEEVDLP